MAVRVLIFLRGGHFGHRSGRAFRSRCGNRICPAHTVARGIAFGGRRNVPEHVFALAGTAGSIAGCNLQCIPQCQRQGSETGTGRGGSAHNFF